MEGCKAIFGGDKGRERLKEICLTRPVRTGRRGRMCKKRFITENGKWISLRDAINHQCCVGMATVRDAVFVEIVKKKMHWKG